VGGGRSGWSVRFSRSGKCWDLIRSLVTCVVGRIVISVAGSNPYDARMFDLALIKSALY
jgi:hypothetical protein